MIAPIVISLAIMVPLTYGAADAYALATRPPESRRARRKLARRANLLLAAATAIAIAGITLY